jgi:four helix bundle protein
MIGFADVLSERFLVFAVRIIEIEKQICKTYSGRHIFGQLFRAGTSSGANYEEARAGESSADYIHKMQIVLKELREAHFWIRLIVRGKLIRTEIDVLDFLSKESLELAKIAAKSIITAKKNSK